MQMNFQVNLWSCSLCNLVKISLQLPLLLFIELQLFQQFFYKNIINLAHEDTNNLLLSLYFGSSAKDFLLPFWVLISCKDCSFDCSSSFSTSNSDTRLLKADTSLFFEENWKKTQLWEFQTQKKIIAKSFFFLILWQYLNQLFFYYFLKCNTGAHL